MVSTVIDCDIFAFDKADNMNMKIAILSKYSLRNG